MPSIFSRSRTNSTPKKLSLSTPLDEFGRISSRLSGAGSPSPLSKKDKKKAKEQEKRLRTQSSAKERPEFDQSPDVPPPIPDGSFLPLNLDSPRAEVSLDQPKEHDYGYLSYERHVVLGLEQVARLVVVLSDELGTRGGVTTPFIFSTTALDISSSAIKRLIRTFLDTCLSQPSQAAADAEARWRDEARFAGPHELGMCLRWGLARVIRSVGGHDVRGLLSWERYVEFRDTEAALGYPPAHFATLLPGLAPTLQTVIIAILTLLSRLTANSTSSGHTPPTLSPLFGPLVFGLGPATLAFHHTYMHYLRAVNAMEHLQLAFIRWQDCPTRAPGDTTTNAITGSAAALGVPTRLKEWIKGYPAMLPFLQDPAAQHPHNNNKPQPRRGVRTVRVMSVRRNVRMYSPDLVKTAASWAHRTRSASGSVGGPSENGLVVSKEWGKIAPPTLKLMPRYSEAYKKRMDMPLSFHPDSGAGTQTAPGGLSNAPSSSSYASTMSAATGTTTGDSNDYFGLGMGGREGEDRFRSLTDLKWGEFESMGFSELGDQKKLQFDLTESARTERSTKRGTLSWNDFSSAGFSRNDDPLSATLQFSSPVAKTISAWPAHNAEMSKKLKKTQKALPPFGWDTEPVVGSEEVIEEAFVDVFCDLVYGGGWMDLERYEELDRDCNWALVEFKSLPPNRTTASGGSDPRTAATLILFEEFVPLEYRQQLAVTSSTRRRLPSLFSQSSKSKQWKQAATLNGRPYVVGHVPRSPTYREVEFEGLLRGGAATKVISLGSKPSIKGAAAAAAALTSRATAASSDSRTTTAAISGPLYVPAPAPELLTAGGGGGGGPKSEEMHSDYSTATTTKSSQISTKRSSSRFRLPGGIPVPSPGSGRKTGGLAPAEYSSVDFETRLASYSDDEYEPEAVKQKRREAEDDAWVDILVGTQNRRLGGQDAERRAGGGGGGKGKGGVHSRRSDPDIVSLEVAQVLAGVRDRTPSLASVHHERVDRDPGGGLDHLHDLDVDEIETVPRTSGATSEYTTERSVVEQEQQEHEDLDLDPAGVDDEVGRPALTARQMARNKRRMGYFDLHPERRPTSVDPSGDDPRARLAYDADSGEDDTDDDDPASDASHAAQQPLRKLPVPPEASRPSPAVIPTLKIEVPKAAANANGISNGNGNGTHEATPIPTSKTAALIEMYRERERGTSPKPGAMPIPAPIPIAPLQPSRLPVRSASLPSEVAAASAAAGAGAGAAAPSPIIAAPVPKVASSPSEPPLIEPPRVPLEETGRASPARYVHGAPLHNVLEEEEED